MPSLHLQPLMICNHLICLGKDTLFVLTVYIMKPRSNQRGLTVHSPQQISVENLNRSCTHCSWHAKVCSDGWITKKTFNNKRENLPKCDTASGVETGRTTYDNKNNSAVWELWEETATFGRHSEDSESLSAVTHVGQWWPTILVLKLFCLFMTHCCFAL